jgi:Leucine-rich repeat (LRR) protein
MLLCSALLGYYMSLVRAGQAEDRILCELFPEAAEHPRFLALQERKQRRTLPNWLQWLPLSEHCHATESLELSGRECREPIRITAGQLAKINQLTGLKRLALWRTDICDGDLLALDNLKQLELLDVHHCANIDQDKLTAQIDQWPRLRRIILGNRNYAPLPNWMEDPFHDRSIAGDGVTNLGLEILANHPKKPVQELTIRGFNKKSLDYVSKLTRLTSLEIELAHGTDPQILNLLYRLPKLKDLRVVGIEPIPLPWLKAQKPKLWLTFSPIEYSNFRSLFLNWRDRVDTIGVTFGPLKGHSNGVGPFRRRSHEPNGAGIFYVSGFGASNKTILSARIAKTGDDSWYLADRITRLFVQETYRSIDFYHWHSYRNREYANMAIGEWKKFLNSISRFSNLRELSLRHLQVDNIRFLDSLKNLQHLSIESNQFYGDTTIDLGKLPDLRSLTVLSNWSIHEGNFIGWKKATRLNRVYVDSQKFGEEFLSKIAELPSLEEFVFVNRRRFISREIVSTILTNQKLKTCHIAGVGQPPEAWYRESFPKQINFSGRLKPYDPAEPRYPKAFSRLRRFESDSVRVSCD